MQPITRRSFSAALVAGAALSMFPAAGWAATIAKAKNVVLVHGAYADASCWLDVIPHLQAADLNVMAVQNPLTSFADDVEATKRILALMDGPTVLVGHSYSGMLVTEAGVDPKVTALVYIAARAPDAGEDYTALAKQYPTPPASAGLVHSGGYAQLSEEAFVRDFAGDLPVARAKALYAVQGRISDTLFTAKTTVAAWRSKPSWYAVSKNDRTINPDLERFMAKRMNATTIELDASHVSLISQPHAVANLILAAAGSSEHS
ncbi:pimeloyl-ACP methyl ester carboxylesterase [Rhizobium sp. BK316]|uniref:alpha/beta fold hydrolase n=1 Tax=Rhizobium sp. BK316 TaxID=2587053 RepID=UPI0016077CCE|nr:alpha/beta hydrolase [Rhizobium sp. BK316]MBB3410400.1 pimeloyl-ACP methyl ester carboxylesterase [Rhizobium sp. BK316]